MSKCNCFEEMQARLESRITDQLELNGIKHAGEIDFNWQNKMWLLSGGDQAPVSLKFEYKFRKLKKDNTPYANATKEETHILMSYCPFCGRKYQKDGDEATDLKFVAGRVHDCLAVKAPESLSPAMTKLWEACQKDDKWMLALSAVSQGFCDYDQYANFMAAWPEYTLIAEPELILIDEMYKAALDG